MEEIKFKEIKITKLTEGFEVVFGNDKYAVSTYEAMTKTIKKLFNDPEKERKNIWNKEK